MTNNICRQGWDVVCYCCHHRQGWDVVCYCCHHRQGWDVVCYCCHHWSLFSTFVFIFLSLMMWEHSKMPGVMLLRCLLVTFRIEGVFTNLWIYADEVSRRDSSCCFGWLHVACYCSSPIVFNQSMYSTLYYIFPFFIISLLQYNCKTVISV